MFVGALLFAFALPPASAGPGLSGEPGFFMRVLDTGQGLSCVLRFPTASGSKYVIYDAGKSQSKTFDGIKTLVPLGSTIEWLILSHTDADHLAAVDEIYSAYTVKKVVFPNNPRTTDTWNDANGAITLASIAGRTELIRPSDPSVAPGKYFVFGSGRLTFACGFDVPPASWGFASGTPEYNNAGSVVVRVSYKGKRILLTGDAVGRHIGGASSECIGTEKYLVDHSGTVSIRADVLVAPHHGGDNGGSNSFIQNVRPSYLVFAAGRGYSHPRLASANRYLGWGLPSSQIFRTDREDDEGPLEWDFGRIVGRHDPAGDDDVDINISPSGVAKVQYRD